MLAIDQALFLWLNERLSNKLVVAAMSAITWLGPGLVLAVIIVALMAWRDRPALRLQFPYMVVSVASSGLVVTLIKLSVARPRPSHWAISQHLSIHTHAANPPDYSFPSGHTQTAFGTAVYLALLYPKLAPFVLILAVLVGLSRICLGVHFPLDVLVGGLIGTAASVLTFRLRQRSPRAATRPPS